MTITSAASAKDYQIDGVPLPQNAKITSSQNTNNPYRQWLGTWSDVAPSSILIGGQSRGGILAVAYAGKHPEQVRGVVNFVGGWMGEICSSAKLINETLFKKGTNFAHPSLWLYGKGDPFYSVKHSEGNFEAFSKAGGKGEFNVFDVPGNYGHYVAVYEELWGDLLDEYLKSLP